MTDNCPNCQHPQHQPGTECAARVEHGPHHWHLCLCLARPSAATACPPQMACQGGTLGYADIWYLQRGHSLSGLDGVVSPELWTDGPVSVGFPSAAALSETDEQRADRLETERAHARDDHEYCGITCEAEFTTEKLRNSILWRAAPGSAAMLDELLRRARTEAAAVQPGADRDLRDRIAQALAAVDGMDWSPTAIENAYNDLADAVLAILPAPTDRAAVIRWCADRVRSMDSDYAVQEAAENLDGIAVELDEAQQTEAPAPHIPTAHYRRDDGVDCCVHAVPVGPNSCAACRELDAFEAQRPGESR